MSTVPPVRRLVAARRRPRRPTAVVYCEANFGRIDGKTANGLVRHSERYEILVGHRQRAGRPRRRRGARRRSPTASRSAATSTDAVAARRRGARLLHLRHGAVERHALARRAHASCSTPSPAGMDIVNGLHEFLNDDPEFAAAAAAHDVEILDVRRPRAKKDLRMFSGRIAEVTCPRIAVLGTDGAIGKRTTATILTTALNERGIKAVHGRHRPDRPDPGRPLRRRPRRHPVRSSARARWRPPSSRRSRASTPT